LATKQVIDVSPLLFILSKNEYFSSHAKRENVIARDQAIFFLHFQRGFSAVYYPTPSRYNNLIFQRGFWQMCFNF